MANLIVDIAAVVIALAALAVSVYAGLATRKHNRLSVKPHLRFHVEAGPLADQPARVALQNHGVGPAFIRSVKLETATGTYDGDAKGWEQALKALELSTLNHSHHSLTQGDVLPAGGIVCIVQFDRRRPGKWMF